MKEKVLVDTQEETVKVKWDGERFAIIQRDRYKTRSIILLSPNEMLDLIEFAAVLGGKE